MGGMHHAKDRSERFAATCGLRCVPRGFNHTNHLSLADDAHDGTNVVVDAATAAITGVGDSRHTHYTRSRINALRYGRALASEPRSKQEVPYARVGGCWWRV